MSITTHKKRSIEIFFDQYAQRMNDALRGSPADIEGAAGSFAECFVEASPAGIICGKNDTEFRLKLPEGYTFYKNIGITSMEILSKDIVALDELHTLAKIHWKSNFTRKDKSTGAIEFEVVYFIQSREEHKIFAYITGDEQKALKENGLI